MLSVNEGSLKIIIQLKIGSEIALFFKFENFKFIALIKLSV